MLRVWASGDDQSVGSTSVDASTAGTSAGVHTASPVEVRVDPPSATVAEAVLVGRVASAKAVLATLAAARQLVAAIPPDLTGNLEVRQQLLGLGDDVAIALDGPGRPRRGPWRRHRRRGRDRA